MELSNRIPKVIVGCVLSLPPQEEKNPDGGIDEKPS